MDSNFHGKLLATKVFLEGQEVPSTSVRVTGGVKTPCTCIVEIPYTDAAHKLPPRTLIHVFVMDSRYHSGLQPGVKVSSHSGETTSYVSDTPRAHMPGGETINSPVETEDSNVSAMVTDRNNLHNYKLMFAGEVVQYKYNKVGSLRRIVLVFLHCFGR